MTLSLSDLKPSFANIDVNLNEIKHNKINLADLLNTKEGRKIIYKSCFYQKMLG